MNFNMIANGIKENEILENYIKIEKEEFFKNEKDCSFHIESEKGDFVGGIVAKYIFDTMQIKSIYVREAYRNNGFASELLQYVENLAKLNGIKRIIVKIYSFQNKEFFIKKGYENLFEINPCFENYSKYYLVKRYF